MVRAVVIAVIGFAGGAYLLLLGLSDVQLGAASRATPTPVAYRDFVTSPPAPGSVVEISGGLLYPNAINETDNSGAWTAAFTALGPLSDRPNAGANQDTRFTLEAPGVLVIADPVDGSDEFDRLARGETLTGMVLGAGHPIEADLRAMLSASFPDLDAANAPKLRVALRDTSTVGYAKLGAGAALVLLPLVNVFTARKKG